jgi:hypothetical protein
MKQQMCIVVVLALASFASAAVQPWIDNFESYADSAALNAAWVVNTNGNPATETLVNESGNQVMKFAYNVSAPFWAQTKYSLPGAVWGTSGVNWSYWGYTSLSFDYKITDVGSGNDRIAVWDCWGQTILTKSIPAAVVGWTTVTVDFVTDLQPGMNLQNLAVIGFAAESTWFSTPTGDIYIDNVHLNPIPEPATMALLSLGGLALLRKRK